MAYEVVSVFTRTNATYWGRPGMIAKSELEYGPRYRPRFLHKRIVVVNVPHSVEPVTISLKGCMRDEAVDKPLCPMLFLLPAYARSGICGRKYMRADGGEHASSLTGIRVRYDSFYGYELKAKMDTHGNTLVVEYAEVYCFVYLEFIVRILTRSATVGWRAGARCQDFRGEGRTHHH